MVSSVAFVRGTLHFSKLCSIALRMIGFTGPDRMSTGQTVHSNGALSFLGWFKLVYKIL